MKIAISYPPLENKKGTATLSQNRQFQWFSKPTYIYPVIPASAATSIHQNGYEVFWDDGIAEELSYPEWLERIIKEKPDVIVIETKTPVIKQHWEIIKELKNKSLETVSPREISRRERNCHPSGGHPQGENPIIVLMGDHVTTLSEESFDNSPVDYVLTGGDYDFMLLNLANHLSKGEELEAGWYFCTENTENTKTQKTLKHENTEALSKKLQITDYRLQITNTGKFQLNHDLNSLPLIDCELTRWQLYGFKNGNFKYTPGSYIMSSRDCWYGQCTFCSWANTLFPGNCYRTRKVENVLDEIGELIKLGVKEIMDDSGTFPIKDWLTEFCSGMIERGYDKKVRISCNMRINAIKDLKIYQLMKQAGFRMILFGLESANQKTLAKINKGLSVEEIEPCLKICQQAGLEPHITVMVGYPWETKGETENTLNFAKKLFHDGIVDSLQATIMIPYPGTELYRYCQENNLFVDDLVETHCNASLRINYDRFDQREQIMQSSLSDAEIKKMTASIYWSSVNFKYLVNKILAIRSWRDIKWMWTATWEVLGKVKSSF